MTARHRHGSGPPPRRDSRAGSGPSKAEHARNATADNRRTAKFLDVNPDARRLPDSACGKTRYQSLAAAETALALIVRYGDHTDRVPVRAYACPTCGGWHLTSWSTPNPPESRSRRG